MGPRAVSRHRWVFLTTCHRTSGPCLALPCVEGSERVQLGNATQLPLTHTPMTPEVVAYGLGTPLQLFGDRAL